MQVTDRTREMAIRPLWRLGFRPFFLGGTAFAALAVALWVLALHGMLPRWQPAGGVLAWHRHEMPFGFGVAIVAGFLLTAVQNWTGHRGLHGRPLAALFALWLAARLAWALGAPTALVVGLSLPFLPLLAGVLGWQLWRVRQRGNYPMVLVLALLAAADGLSLLGLWRGDDGLQRQAVLAALWLIGALMAVIGGRVIPFFTQRGLGRPEQVRLPAWLDIAVLVLSLGAALLFASGLALQPRAWLALPFGALAALHGWRLWRWHDRRLWAVPLLWSLHLAYAWLAVAALGMALWALGLSTSSSLASHGLAVGGMGGLVLGMVARVSLGHSGRPLVPPTAMAWAFAGLQLSALARVALVPLAPAAGLWLAGAAWVMAFALFVRHYAPILLTARADGQPG